MEINTITVCFMQRVSILLRNYISWVMQRSAEVINVSFNQSIYQLISLLQSKCTMRLLFVSETEGRV